MAGLCYWCESRGIMQCKHCTRSFCKFCIKNGHSQDESKRVCFICGCFEITETNVTKVVSDSDGSCLRDREMQDMLHRYEDLCSNEKLARSIMDLLTNIDTLTTDKLPIYFEVMKSNILSMLHDIQKVETMINNALQDNRSMDIQKVLMPLLKVVTKHHVFKRLGRPQISSDIPADDITYFENGVKSVDNCDMAERYANEFIDLTDEERMDVSRNNSEDSDNERMQRSPLRLADEEKSTIFEVQELKDEDDDIAELDRNCNVITTVKNCVPSIPSSDTQTTLSCIPAKNLSLISSRLNDNQLSDKCQLNVSIKDSPKVHEFVEGLFESINSTTEEKVLSKKRRVRQLSDVERRTVRLRSETAVNNSPSEPHLPVVDLNSTTFKAFQSDLTQAESDLTGAASTELNQVKSVILRSNSRKLNDLKESTVPRVIKKQDKLNFKPARDNVAVDNHCKKEVSYEGSSSVNKSSSSSECNTFENLNKFSKIQKRSKNSHLVCPSPITYERPFLLKETKQSETIDDIKPIQNKTWSWERQVPLFLSRSKTLTNGDVSSVICKPIVIPKSAIEPSSSVMPPRGRPRLSAIEPLQKKRSSPSTSSLVDSDEPKKKRGRPRKYFNNYTPDFNAWSHSVSGQEEKVDRDSSNTSDT